MVDIKAMRRNFECWKRAQSLFGDARVMADRVTMHMNLLAGGNANQASIDMATEDVRKLHELVAVQ